MWTWNHALQAAAVLMSLLALSPATLGNQDQSRRARMRGSAGPMYMSRIHFTPLPEG